MKKMKKVLALLLAGMMMLAMLTACGGDGSQTPNNGDSQPDAQEPSGGDTPAPTPAADGDIPTITWYQVGGGEPANLASWTEKVNAYLEEKIGVHLDIQCISWGPWGDRRSVIVQTNEPYDIMFTDASTYANDVKMGAFADITDLLDQCPGIEEAIPADFIEATKIGGRIYGIPAYKDSAAQQFFVWTKEQVEAYYPDWANVHTTDQATAALKALKEGTGEAPMLLNKDGISAIPENRYDGMGVGLSALGVSYRDGSNKVVAVYEQPDVLDQYKIVQQWMEAGYINSDAATANEATGMCGVGIAQGWPAAAKGWGDGRGAEVVVSTYNEPVLSTQTALGSMACISASSAHPLEALKLIELVNTDTKLRDMLAYGEEGVNFEYVEMEVTRNGETATEQRVHKINTDWTLAAYTQGKTIHMTPEDTSDVNPYVDEILIQNENAVRSPAMGFSFDNSNVADKIAACEAIFNEYKGIIHTGTGDVEANVAAMMAAMRDSGFDEVVAEVQAQYDAWLASK
ncbi:MAG: ABC transporter substrate-binding protein [Oscillospiraceae bacterium]|nr:ABC transporter substrate-binding protein [Oscillospiraceae bacterium]